MELQSRALGIAQEIQIIWETERYYWTAFLLPHTQEQDSLTRAVKELG